MFGRPRSERRSAPRALTVESPRSSRSSSGSISRQELDSIYAAGGHPAVMQSLVNAVGDTTIYSVSAGWRLWDSTLTAKSADGSMVFDVVDLGGQT